MILALLEGALGGLRVRDNWLKPGGISLCRTLSLSIEFARNLRAHLGHYTRRSGVGFCKGEVPSLRSLETF